MRPWTIDELYDYTSANNIPFLVKEGQLPSVPFMEDYLGSAGLSTAVDTYMADTKGFFTPLREPKEGESIADYYNRFQTSIFSMLFKNSEKYKRLYALRSVDYKPLDNYNMVENGTDTNTDSGNKTTTHGEISANKKIGGVTVTREYGETTDSTSYGKQAITTNYGGTTKETAHGSENISENLGAVSKTDTLGSHTDVTTDGVAGYNQSSFSNSTTSSTEMGSQNNMHTESARTNTTTKQPVTDTETTSARTDSESIDSHVDTHMGEAHTDTDTTTDRNDTESISRGPTVEDKTGSRELTHEMTRRGNIGVTTSQQMAQSEIDLWSTFDFYQIIIDDIVTNLCTFYESGNDVMLSTAWNERLRRY